MLYIGKDPFMALDEQTLTNCRKMQRDAQRIVYQDMAPKLYRTCKRYLKKEEEVEEALADAFYTIFTKLDQLKDWKAFEGWARKITVNQCLLTLRRQVNFNLYWEDVPTSAMPAAPEEALLETEDLMQLVTQLPSGCQAIFNLFVIEGYSHKEIAEQLRITEGTSKSQLNVAKTKLQHLINQLYYQKAK
jgi:RNA polymerase sigma-70 factor (ECF subfamily)